MRCLTLARALRGRGAAVSFVCREHTGHLGALILDMGFAVHLLEGCDGPDATGEESLAHADWLGATQAQDATQTLAVVEAMGVKPDWLIVDHYGIDQYWEKSLRPAVGRIMVIDDLADRQHDCDVLLDQNLVAQMDVRYGAWLPASCRQLLGPRYALLQPGYAERHQCASPRKGPVRHILIYFGGADQCNLTGRSISAFLALDRPDIEVEVVISTSCPHANAILRQTQGYRNIQVRSNLPSLAPLMMQADLAIGAGGGASWERLCVGLPALVVTLADNQRPIAAELHRRQLIRWLGDQGEVDEADFLQALRELLAHGTLQNEFSNGMQVVDGKGVDRVLAAMTVNSTVPMRIRKASFADEAMLLEWANDPVTRANAFSGSQITSQAHKQWLLSRLNNGTACRMYIVETAEGEALGQVRFELSEAAWVVDYSLSPVFRGRGLGRRLLEVALSHLRSEEVDAVVFGEVKVNNFASRKVFESLGFSVLSEEQGTVKYTSKVKVSDMPRPAIVIATPHPRHDDLEQQLRQDLPDYEIVRMRSREELTFNALGKIKPVFVFFPHWSWLIPEDVYSSFDCVIFHMTDLPYGRGGSPLQNLIVRGHRDTILSAFKCVKELDAGPLYLKRPLSLVGKAEKILQQAAVLTERMIVEIVEKRPLLQPQKGDVVEFRRRRPEDGDLSRLEELRQVYDHIRMLDAAGYPPAFLNAGPLQFEFTDARMGEEFIEAGVRIRRTCND